MLWRRLGKLPHKSYFNKVEVWKSHTNDDKEFVDGAYETHTVSAPEEVGHNNNVLSLLLLQSLSWC